MSNHSEISDRLSRTWLNPLVACLVILGLLLSPARAQAAGISVQVDEAAADFPRTINFHIRVEAGAKIDRLTLTYGVSAQTCAQTQARHEMDFAPSGKLDLSWDWDLTRGDDLPPGVEVWWQWQIHAVDGSSLTTDVKKLAFEDPNFEWKKLEQGQVTLYWAEGSRNFGEDLLAIAVASLDRLSKNAHLTPNGSIRIIIYPSANDMKKALVYSIDWMGGVAFTDYRVVMVGIPPAHDTAWSNAVIPHELAHLIFEQRTSTCLSWQIPTWLHEGMAMYAEGPVVAEERAPLKVELKAEKLQPLTELAHGFPGDSRLAELAYLHSKLIVDYLIETYGADQLEALFDRLKQGQGIDASLRATYGLDTAGIDQAWSASLGFGEAPEPDHSTPTALRTATTAPTLALAQPFQARTATPTLTSTITPTLTPAPLPPENAFPTPVTDLGARLPDWLKVAGGCLAGLLIILFLAWLLSRRRKKPQPPLPPGGSL